MTITEYMNPDLFSLTSQPGLTLDQQMQLDSANYDEYAAACKNHEQLTEEERRIGYELEAKHAAKANVLQQLQAQQNDGSPQTPNGMPLM